MSTTVFLVRHATHSQVDRVLVGRTADVRLSPAGCRQAEELAAWFAGKAVAVVQSSPRERARDTAEPIAAALGLAVEIVPALDEIDFGAWTGCAFDALAADPRWQAWNSARGEARAPGGETMAEAQQRVVGHIERLRERLNGDGAVLVSHCDVIRAALLHFLRLPVDAYGQLDVPPASVSTIELDGASARVVEVNERRVA